MPTDRRLVCTLGSRAGDNRLQCAVDDVEDDVSPGLQKKLVIWRCAGSLAAPANCRFVRGPDMAEVDSQRMGYGGCL